MADSNASRWIRFLRQYGPAAQNDSMYDEQIRKVSSKRLRSGRNNSKREITPSIQMRRCQNCWVKFDRVGKIVSAKLDRP